MKGQEWKDIRSSVTPAFTTGKIKRVSTIPNKSQWHIKVKEDKLENGLNSFE